MINIIMPMAGDGVRFRSAGYNTIKPLVDVAGKPMFSLALESIPLDSFPHTITFIIKSSDNASSILSNSLKSLYPDAMITSLDKPTKGPVETIYPTLCTLPSNEAVLILDCDLSFRSTDFNHYLSSQNYFSNSVVYFHSNLSHFSYAQVDNSGTVIRTAEKEVISNIALAGAYFFNNATNLIKVIDEPNRQSDYKYYISPLYNALDLTKAYKLDHYQSLGTPQELELYLSTINN